MKYESTIRQTIGQNIKKFRIEKGMTQEELSTLCNVHQHYISDIELGKRNFTILSLERLAKALNVNIETLLIRNTGG